MQFTELIAPLSEAQFMAEYWGRRPLHVPAHPGSGRADVIGWDRLNALLQIRPHWTGGQIELVLNSRPVNPEFYLETLPDGARLASPAKVETFLAMGATLVADGVERIAPEVRAITDMLAERFAARCNANLYASFEGVQAFASHCDLHEVFAVHCAGEKRWRIYADRAEDPLVEIEGEDAQARIDAAKGPVLLEVTLRPGDLLYIPRGYFHDALAASADSLHLTFGVAPHSGRVLFRLLEELAIADPAFRAYLPDAREREGAALRERLADLAARLASLATGPALADAVGAEQRKLADPAHPLSLPALPALVFYARTGLLAEALATVEGAVLRTASGDERIGALLDAAQYLLERPAISTHELRANFAHHPAQALDGLVALAERQGLLQRFQPNRG